MATAVVKAEQAEITTCKCGKPVTFEAVPCGCRLACDKCAMKLVRLGVFASCRRAATSTRPRRAGVGRQVPALQGVVRRPAAYC